MRPALFLLICTASLFGLEPIKLPEPPVEPTFLAPVNPEGREYAASIRMLLGKRWGKGTMIYIESTYNRRDFVVSVWGKDHADYNYNHALHNFVTVMEVAPSKQGTAAIRTDDIDVPIDDDFAIA